MALPYVVCAFHTDDPIYNAEIARLRASLVAHGLPHVIKTIPPMKKWRHGARHKPTFVRAMLAEVAPLDVLYLDADAEVLSYPSLFDRFEGSLGVYLRPGKELWSAILYVKNDDRGREYARLWEESLELFPTRHDQTCLHHVVETYGATIGGLQPLPVEYSCKFPKPGSKAVIGQYQASNRFREAGGSL
jgi:hypothetical protein